MSQSTASSYQELMNQAVQYLRAREYDKAVEMLDRISKSLSRLSYEALHKRPDLWALFVMACTEGLQIAGEHGLVERVRSFRDRIQRVMPADHVTQLVLTFAEVYLGEMDEARKHIAGLVDNSELTFVQRLELAGFALKASSPELALQVLEHTAVPVLPKEDDPQREEIEWNIIRYWRTYIEALLQAGRLDEIDEPLRQLEKIAPRRIPYPFITQAFLKRKDYARAIEYADRTPELAGRGLLRGLVAAAQGKMDWARDEWWRVAREPLDVKGERLNFDAWMECALRMDDQEKMASALEAGTPALEDAAWFRLYRSLYRAKQGEAAEALSLFREAFQNMLDMTDVPVAREWVIWHISGLVEQVLPEDVRGDFLTAVQEVGGTLPAESQEA